MLVLPQLNLLVTDLPEPGQQRLFRRHCYSQRQRIDKNPEHGFRLWNGGVSAGSDRAENNLLFATVPAQKQGPRTLKKRVQGQVVLVCERLEVAGQRC